MSGKRAKARAPGRRKKSVDDALKNIAAQANANLSKKEQIHLSAHMLRHTALGKAAEKDIRYAMKLSGHTCSQYIWRYTEPSANEFDEAIEQLYDWTLRDSDFGSTSRPDFDWPLWTVLVL